MITKDALLQIILSQYKLDLYGIHGISHWERVENLGFFLANSTKADISVISLFACLHDSQRQNEGEDLDHGKRAADFIEKLYKDQTLLITSSQVEKLQIACYYHNSKVMQKVDDITIQTCWDSDRLDLWRLGIRPNTNSLYTEAAKKEHAIEYAKELNARFC